MKKFVIILSIFLIIGSFVGVYYYNEWRLDEHAKQYAYLGENRPIQDEIVFYPSNKYSKEGFYRFTSEHPPDREKEANKLVIRKRGDDYYWDSQGGLKLLKTTGKFGSIKDSYYTLFVAYDASGIILIRHDQMALAGACPEFGDNYDGAYWEVRANDAAMLSASVWFFPDKPDDWCQTPIYIPRKFLQEVRKNLKNND